MGRGDVKVIIVTGLPACNKTDFARTIARWERCPFICLESILEELQSASKSKLVLNHPKTENLFSVGIGILIQQAAEQLMATDPDDGISIVLEFPLSSLSQLQELIKQLELKFFRYIDKLLIIKCKPQNKTRWRMEFEKRDKRTNTQYSRYKINNWDDVLKASKQDFELTSSDIENCTVKYVSKLEMDPYIEGLPFEGICKVDTETPLLFFEALDYLLSGRSYEKEGSHCILTMQQWADFKYNHIGVEFGVCLKGRDFHTLTTEMPQSGHWLDVECGICGVKVSGSCYFCRSCPLALHKVCAEMEGRNLTSFQPSKFTASINEKLYPCKSCKQKEKGFSPRCKPCLFETHLQSSLWPTIVVHPLHQHFLQTQIRRSGGATHVHLCGACGNWIKKDIYYYCNHCGLFLGFPCATKLLVKVIHKHVGYEHPMELRTSSSFEGLDNYICHVCWEERDPEHWHYYCDDCDYSVHVGCMGILNFHEYH